ncbi:MAG: hypothetical protein MUF87_20895 [Anaerolineae bacterium]|jgi:hypothetical protein|nr:hypothetical protein [Anaerolineae bacterium]
MDVLKVAISSSTDDLSAIRIAAQAIITQFGLLPLLSEDLTPDDYDIFVGIYAFHPGRRIDRLMRAYQAAIQARKPILALMPDLQARWPVDQIAQGADRDQIEQLKAQIIAEQAVRRFKNVSDFQLQLVLGLHQIEAQLWQQRGMITMQPIFGPPALDAQFRADVFMIMPFRPAFFEIYDQVIVPVVQGRGLTIKRGDDYFSRHSIIEEIWAGIYHAQWVIAELTGRNDNVAYELGIAHTLGKSGVILTQDVNDIPFDLRHLRIIQYQNTPEGLAILRGQLDRAVAWITAHE